MDDNFGRGEIDKVVITERWIVTVDPHVGSEVCIEVWITEEKVQVI